MKKHVYCEKPLTHNIWECRKIREAAKAAGVATQMGTQIHALNNYRRVVELVQSGAIGNVTECHVWVSRAWGLQSEEAAKRNRDIVFVTERPKEAQTPPAHFNWDLFLGPAMDRPFNEVYFPGPKWYRWWDFGSGTMSDLGSHWNDLPFWALKLDAPLTIEAAGGPAHPELAPATMSATYEYGPRGTMGPCKLTWYQGELRPAPWTERKSRSGTAAAFSSATKECCLQTTTSTSCFPRSNTRTSSAPHRRFPRASDTTRSGSKRQRTAARRPATSTTAADSRKPTTWATSPTASAKRFTGTRRNSSARERPGGKIHQARIPQRLGTRIAAQAANRPKTKAPATFAAGAFLN